MQSLHSASMHCIHVRLGCGTLTITSYNDEVLKANESKTEVMWCATSRRQHLLLASALAVDGVMVDPVTSVRDLGIYIDANLSMRTHV